MPIEKINLLKAYGAIVIECETTFKAESANGYVGIARMLAEEIDGVHYIDQFNNENNILAHYETTGPEIWNQMNGKVDYFFLLLVQEVQFQELGSFLKKKIVT